MSALRTLLFRIVFYGMSVPIVLTVPVSALFGSRPLQKHVRFWARAHRWATRAILGIRVRVEGATPPGAILYAAKHQSMFETIEVMLLLDAPVVVMKAELMRIPVWGWAARRYGSIVVDREGSAAAMRQMRREGELAKAANRPILLFPEGTRVAPGETPPLKAGFAGLYRLLALPVVPVAIDSGRVWPKHGPKRAGIIRFMFGALVPPGLPRDQAEAIVYAGINAFELEAAPARSPTPPPK